MRLIIIGFLYVVLVLSPLVARVITKYPEEDKYFPIWSMDLFSRIKFVRSHYLVNLHKVDEKEFDEPVSLFVYFPTIETVTSSPHILIDRMGKSLASGSNEEYSRLKREFEESVFFKNKLVEYSLVRTTYNIIEKYKSGNSIFELEVRREIYNAK